MSNFKDLPLNQLQFYSTAPYPCSYLDRRSARSQVATPSHMIDGAIYSDLVRIGFRRSGAFTYRPICDSCNSCIPVRLNVKKFKPTKSQKRVIKKHKDLESSITELRNAQEHYDLYLSYQTARHSGGGMDQDSREQYRHFLLQSNVNTKMIEFRRNNKVVIVSIVDQLDNGISAVYTFFDTTDTSASYGTYSICWQAELCRTLGLPYLYLGYWIKESPKMAYKTRFRPMEALVNERWEDIEALGLSTGVES